MRLTRHRHQAVKVPRISISQDEITADLIYPARRPDPAVDRARNRGRRR